MPYLVLNGQNCHQNLNEIVKEIQVQTKREQCTSSLAWSYMESHPLKIGISI